MADCKYCTNYYLNLHNRIDDSCMGYGDCRKPYFNCNENLKSRAIYTEDFNSKDKAIYDTQTMIKKLQERGYEVTKIEDNAKLYIVHDEDYCWQAVIRAKNYEEAINKLHKWMDENNHNNGEVWNSRNVKWYMDLCDNNEVIK